MKHSIVFIIFVVVITYLQEAQPICDPALVDSLNYKVWKNEPPSDLISQIDGTWTIYKSNIGTFLKGIKCLQQDIDAKKTSLKELFYRNSHKDPYTLETMLFEGPGFITKRSSLGGHNYSDYMFQLYASQDVRAWYCCGFGPVPFIVISVRDFASQMTWKTRKALQNAEKTIAELGLKVPPHISTDCPAVPSRTIRPRQFSTTLDVTGLHTLLWTVDYNNQKVLMELYSKVSSSSWVAVGFSNNGDISKGDFCMIWTDSQNMSIFQDVWTDETATIHVDDQQDCLYQGFKHENGVIVSAFSRRFDTCDKHDLIIEDGTMQVVWAAGLGPLVSAEGLDLSEAQHGSVSTRLLRPLEADPPLSTDVWSFDVSQKNFKVPKTDIYWCKMVQLSERFKQKHHIVKFESIVTPGNEYLVHHMILKECKTPLSHTEFPCHSIADYERICHRVLAMGLGDFSFPEEAGFTLGGTDSPIYALLEVHYTPPDKTKDWVDSSGLRLHVTPRLRRYDADVMELGLEYNGETALPPGQHRFPVTSRCVASCTAISLPPEGITVFGSRLHSHTTAVGMVTRHLRGGVELPEVVRDNHYDVNKQPMWLLRRSVKVLPGDELITTCWFDTTKLTNVTLTGVGTSNEMCLDILYYYPKVKLSVCKSSVNGQSLNEYFRKTNGEVNLSQDPVSRQIENYKKIRWTPDRVQSLLDLYRRSPIDVQCIWADGHAPGSWRNLTVEPVQHPLSPPTRQCAVVGG